MAEPEQLNIQWFPGHMAKAERMIADHMKLVDAVCEVIDARIPVSSRNPDVARLSGDKPRIIVLNRTDQADPRATALWRAAFRASGLVALETDSKSGKGVSAFPAALREALKDRLAAYAEKGQNRSLRCMVLGIPNVGKSAFINRVAGRRAAVASDKPGVTRGKQWISVGNGLELLDTPGILWPRFDSREAGENLAATGAIRDEVLDRETLAANLLCKLKGLYPEALRERYRLDFDRELTGFDLLKEAAKNRGFLLRGGEVDTGRMAAVLLDEFRGGKLGRITLEWVTL
ncbi:MAG: ribosome biogenesis GTPase YlqF [Firmicutes bacterium]|nr:ribosome biogenesis GTPase YlqF [Bacillota bacterium]